MDTAMKDAVTKGDLLRQLLRQLRFANRNVLHQVIALVAVRENWLEDIKPQRAGQFIERLVMRVKNELTEFADVLLTGALPIGDWLNSVKALALQLKPLFQDAPEFASMMPQNPKLKQDSDLSESANPPAESDR